MDNFSHLLSNNPLFSRVPEDKLEPVISCLKGTRKHYSKRTLLFHSDEPIPCMGIVLEGSVEIFLAQNDGSVTLLSQSHAGELFGQALTVAGASSYMFEIYASDSSEILFLYVPEFTSLKNCQCTYRFIVMENLMKLISEENMNLMMKIQILAQPTLRQKLLLYFSVLSRKQHSDVITLPYGREKLSCYLGCDRSAVSRELGNMKRDGLITGERNHITLLLAAHPGI